MIFSTAVSINGQMMPCNGWVVTDGAQGSVGNAEILTSRKALLDAGFDLIGATEGADGGIPVTISTTDDTNGQVQIFNGEYLSDLWDYRNDVVHVQARNKGGRTVDQRQVLTNSVGSTGTGGLATDESPSGSGFQTQNQTLSGFISSIASQMELTPNVNLQDDPTVGSIFGDATDTILTTIPQTLWGLVNRVAHETGNLVFVGTDGSLYFGPEGQNGDTLNLTWRVPQVGNSIPLLSLNIVRNPRKNSSFKVKVHSHDHTTGQVTTGNAQMSGFTASSGGTSPSYTYHVDGLKQAQAQTKANGIAKDIGKREAVASCTLDYNPNVKQAQPAQLTGEIEAKFSGAPWFVQQFRHEFRMPEGDDQMAALGTSLSLLVNKSGAGSSGS